MGETSWVWWDATKKEGRRMERFDIFQHIAQRTGGDIYVGVVGPVRTGKSTFISRFMELLVLPNIVNAYEKERARDELPQAAAGRTIMTTEPKFVPAEAVEISIGENANVRIRLVDCVGYTVPGALGYEENGVARMVRTPWYDEEISFQQAAEEGTRRVIDEHSTIGLVVVTDGTITEIPREAYVDAERRVVGELKEIGKPFIVVLNSKQPEAERTRGLAEKLATEYEVPVVPLDAMNMSAGDALKVLQEVLYEFPVREINVELPKWVTELSQDHWLRQGFTEALTAAVQDVDKARDVSKAVEAISAYEHASACKLAALNLGTGVVNIAVDVPRELFFKVLSEMTGCPVEGDHHLVRLMMELVHAKNEYDKVAEALRDVRDTGYGIVMPVLEEISFEEPQLIRQGGRFGVKLTAAAPSIHMIRADIKTEVTPIVGTEKQGEEFVRYLSEEFEENPAKIWETEFLGKSLHEMMREGIENKLVRMPENAQGKLRETLEKIVNEGSGGLICIIL